MTPEELDDRLRFATGMRRAVTAAATEGLWEWTGWHDGRFYVGRADGGPAGLWCTSAPNATVYGIEVCG